MLSANIITPVFYYCIFTTQCFWLVFQYKHPNFFKSRHIYLCKMPEDIHSCFLKKCIKHEVSLWLKQEINLDYFSACIIPSIYLIQFLFKQINSTSLLLWLMIHLSCWNRNVKSIALWDTILLYFTLSTIIVEINAV